MSLFQDTADYVHIAVGLKSNGCGHDIAMIRAHYDACVASGRDWFCTVCGQGRHFVVETEATKLRRELDAARQREETIRQQLAENRAALQAKTAALAKKKLALKNANLRAAAGTCPCCKRTVRQMAAHISKKHPEFKAKVRRDT